MGCAEVISLTEVRARKQWDGLRQDLHARFDRWLDDLEAHLPEPEVTLSEISDLVWQLRQDLTGGLTETLVRHAHAGEQSRKRASCPQCERLVTARPAVARTVETMVGSVQLERPYFYCRLCRKGFYPFDDVFKLQKHISVLAQVGKAPAIGPQTPFWAKFVRNSPKKVPVRGILKRKWHRMTPSLYEGQVTGIMAQFVASPA